MCSTSLQHSSLMVQLQSLSPQYAAQDSNFRTLASKVFGPCPGRKTVLRIDCSGGVLEEPIAGTTYGEDVYGSYQELIYQELIRVARLGHETEGNGYNMYGILEGSKEPMIRNGINRDAYLYNSYLDALRGGDDCYWNPSHRYRHLYDMLEVSEGLEERRIEDRVREARYKYWVRKTNGMILPDLLKAANAVGIPSSLLWRWLVLQTAANGGSELTNMRPISRTSYSRIPRKQAQTQHLRFGMASSGPFPPEAININFISHSNINFNGTHLSQHVGQEIRSRPTIEAGGGGNGRVPPSGGSRGGGGRDDDDGDDYDEQFSRFMKLAAEKMRAEAAKAEATKAEAAAAKSMGSLGLISRLGLLVASCWILGNPILADPSLLFKVGIATQVVTGSCFSTFVELQKKGMEFSSRLFAADILFGVTVDIALGGLLATYARMGLMPSASGGFFRHVQRAYSSLPRSIFEGGSPGLNISLKQHILTYFYEGILFGTAGLGCGLICHAIVNLIRTGNRNTKKSEKENAVSSTVKNVFFWGVFLPLSSDTRHQIVKGLEKLIKASPVAKQVPLTALAFALGIKVANNVVGGLLFAFMAKRNGIMKSPS